MPAPSRCCSDSSQPCSRSSRDTVPESAFAVRLPSIFYELGLADIGMETSQILWRGGEPGCLVMKANFEQIGKEIVSLGLMTQDEIRAGPRDIRQTRLGLWLAADDQHVGTEGLGRRRYGESRYASCSMTPPILRPTLPIPAVDHPVGSVTLSSPLLPHGGQSHSVRTRRHERDRECLPRAWS